MTGGGMTGGGLGGGGGGGGLLVPPPLPDPLPLPELGQQLVDEPLPPVGLFVVPPPEESLVPLAAELAPPPEPQQLPPWPLFPAPVSPDPVSPEQLLLSSRRVFDRLPGADRKTPDRVATASATAMIRTIEEIRFTFTALRIGTLRNSRGKSARDDRDAPAHAFRASGTTRTRPACGPVGRGYGADPLKATLRSQGHHCHRRGPAR